MKEYSLYRKLNLFFEDLSVMISSGQSMSSIIGSIADDSDGEWKDALNRMSDKLSTGSSLALSMSEESIFPEYAKKMVDAGEQSGHLEECSESLASFYDRREHIRVLADTALVQPLTLLAILALVLGCFMAFVLPIIGRVYRSLGGSSQIYMGIGYAIGIIAFLAIASVLVVLVSVKSQLKTKGIEEIPLFKKGCLKQLSDATEIAFFMSDFSTRVSGGMLFDYAFAGAAEGVGDEAIRASLIESAKKMSEGERFITALLSSNVFPKTSLHIINSGIKNGHLEQSLTEVTNLLFNEAETEIETMVMRIEPILTGFFTIAISASLLSVMLPLIGVITSIG